MYTIGEFLADLNESTIRYRIPLSNVSADATEDQLYRHVIEEFSDVGLLCNGFNVEKIDDVYYLQVIVEFNCDELEFDEALPMAEFDRVFGVGEIIMPKKFTDYATYFDGSDYESIEVEFIFDKFEAANPVVMEYIKFE